MERTNIRFWHWVNGGAVKLTMKPGDDLEFQTFRRDDEGGSRTYTTMSLEDDVVTLSQYTWSRDCDGTCEYSSVHHCKVTDLRAETNKYTGMVHPAWKESNDKSWQRDHTAEASGY